MKTHLTMSELQALGFEIVKSYEHDEWITQLRQKGNLTIETTWERDSGKFCTQDLQVDEDAHAEGFTADDLKLIDKLFNR